MRTTLLEIYSKAYQAFDIGRYGAIFSEKLKTITGLYAYCSKKSPLIEVQPLYLTFKDLME